MKVAIVGNDRIETQAVVKNLEKLLASRKIELDPENPDVVLTVGGDGTLISAFHKYVNLIDQIRFIGIHTGHLGFYTDWRNFEIGKLVDSLTKKQPSSASYPLLELIITTGNDEKKKLLALNEATIKKVSKTLKADVYIRDQFFESFKGDGLCVSTPTGSTAYSKSLGGAVIHPRLKALQMTEIASINNRVFRTLSSPIVIAPDEWITIKPETGNDDHYVVTYDGYEFNHKHIKKIEYRISQHVIRFDKYQHTHFWNRVEDAFIGHDRKV
ncbi:NAD kinase [uncultured Lactobacillus sp.]|uniref:NAD kinase n=1 Tax=uncultured Lactobacillus sp. TaxID=153152 RepID=UPI00260FDC2F|nr:NAD kinase [uncultured Lactobacillus sp.]